MNTYIWCAVGAVIGWLASVMMSGNDKVVLIENVLVGMFGAFIGGEFVANMVGATVSTDKSFHVSALALAVGGAVAILFVLKLMRGSVGPMRAGKSRTRDRR